MDYLMGIKGPDFVMVCSDTSAAQSIISIKQDEDKLVPVDPTKLFGIAGEAGDRVNFSEFIIANVKLYELRNSTRLSTHAVAHLTRGELAKALRKSPYFCNLLLAGYDEETGPSLYWMDYLATLNKINTGGTGYGAMFVLSLFDKMWRPDITQAEALDMMEQGIAEVKRRLIVAPSSYIVKVIDKDGMRTIKTIGGGQSAAA
ncbi:20S proteasome beta subunit D, type 2 [Dunaliella salina]|uniref:Proteasome subunit beta n=1 Tax=Dunaliella salina TaxID=3046 RepID=A0ABQ7H0M9_DUNSA|nr:20S proteasome beta subunit D, type 2 [Dunaliella salina]|eukprot:KAF5840408.1 20S proteasome beta subunit D, type 2 [Dunaliella salina]